MLVGVLGATTALTVVLGGTDPAPDPGRHAYFLNINLFLAWLPLVFAVGASRATRPWVAVAFGLAWLLFLPNAPYLVTDLIHLSGWYGERWRHVLQFGFAAWTGVMLGVASLRLVHLTVERRIGPVAGWLTVAASTALCAVGVVIGRFQRWNSWDLLTRPLDVLWATGEWVASPAEESLATAVAVAVAVFFGLAYLTVWAFDGLRPAVTPGPSTSDPGRK